MNFLAEGVSLLGGLIAGALATVFGTRATIWIAVLGILASTVWMLFSLRESD
jgi:MFS-type transporter involved in bile tolerance (Atg22 family)